ncbi:hypothetical protein VNO80_09929 [Phaseolus coccineus]|uniref:Uncharacterized protein n=1 Tax=Phaseolus coccineus TaxID=3886 RepID=A0AAN9RE81_PHACN
MGGREGRGDGDEMNLESLLQKTQMTVCPKDKGSSSHSWVGMGMGWSRPNGIKCQKKEVASLAIVALMLEWSAVGEAWNS